MNLLEMFKNLTEDERKEFIELLIDEINKNDGKRGTNTIAPKFTDSDYYQNFQGIVDLSLLNKQNHIVYK